MTQGLRILLVTQSDARDRLLNALVDHSDPTQVSFRILTVTGSDGPLVSDMHDRGVLVETLGLKALSVRSSLQAIPGFARMARRTRPDVVHSLLFYASLTTALAHKATGRHVPWVLARHHNQISHLLHRPWHVRVDCWMGRQASCVVAVSEAVRETLVSEGVEAAKVSVVSNGLDWDALVAPSAASRRAWRDRFGSGPLLVAAGRLDPQKDYPTLLRAFGLLHRLRPDAHLAVAGVGPPAVTDELRDLASELGIASSVTFLGWTDDIYGLMASADVFVQSSIDESFSQTLVEAMGLGIPIAATTPGGSAEVVRAWYDLLEPGDPAALASRIADVLSDLSPAREYAHSIVSEVRAAFSAAPMAAGYLDVYRRALQRSS